ncbi:D-alanyl-D-alanine endopeptidase [Aeromonas hydrophila]|jgi:D-alanyl-D-alanine endopeptidase (penicillin-binding protein 7)|uniref:D-alanyl-D-alanine carboxypeptidase family protein n=2 Tax=Aeromonas hydrophila TaxID=644 RepID=A0KL35_AERHH|nr:MULTISPECIES: D-alanyl-D-alanine endopeptidase [Aeromonas]ABK37296.1 D-alanyl-D-alanine carboxypeptidase family protein [Aeromonas hydrophila subsp. hydrophila ATCC 7966]AKA17617.1 peptidase S11 [Aeromonas hydrophila]AUZ75320.1 D-alanyl-D-alanine endopeptidase [Aeromonas sp. ASNIH4]AWA06828.1 D-alanyl-D-alanine endopeptidase [Aeromonas hydrophila subsp. hydrophila]AXV34613.1 peptidase S11 [Aeromonas hydrophila]
MITRPFLTLLLGAFLVPVSMESAQANPFSAQSHSPNSFLEQRNDLALSSAAFVVANPRTGEVLSERNANRVMPIASITKLMTALVVLDANQRLSEMLTVTMADVDRLKGTGSRLAVGSRLSRADMLHIALMSSENRAASALARNYPGGQRAFIEAMNAKARMLGMWSTQFSDSTGLTPRNVSSAHDLAKLVAAASTYPLIRQYSSTEERMVRNGKRQLHYLNSNRLVREGSWPISLSKTGYIREAGRCLVMATQINREPVIMVLLNADTPNARVADAKRIKSWLETSGRMSLTAQSTPQTKLFSSQ